MKTTKRLIAALLALLMTLSLAACGGGSSSTAAPSGGADTNKKTDLVICMPEDVQSFDPVVNTAISSQATCQMIYTRLYMTNAEAQPELLFAKEMKVVDENTIEFALHEGKFSDGSEITADDVVYSLNRALASPNFSTLLKGVKTFEKVDDHTVRAITEGPVPYIQLALAHPGTGIIPKAYGEKAEANNDWNEPVCSGPYKVQSRKIGANTVIVKNENYWDNGGDTEAQNTSLTFSVVPEASSRTIQVQTGEADVNFSFATADYNTVTADSNVKLYKHTGTTVQYLAMNTSIEPFNDENVRKAINYAIDRAAVVQIVEDGFGTVQYSNLPPTTLGYNENPAGITYDLAKAKEFMAKSNYPNGFTTKFLAFNDRGKRVCEATQQYLADIGITAEIETYDSNVRMEMSNNNQIPIMAAQWGAMSDGALVLPRLFTEEAIGGVNFAKYFDPELDELFAIGRGTYDTTVRAKAYADAVAHLCEHCVWCPLYIPDAFVLTRADLQGVVQDGESIIQLFRLHY
ncbi:MAG: ABC transporter substrate-binding protein [Lachnospiraceae bacterium]|nr:ABC transporter substrate-binding protein [Lachnospiraceae bacterium]